MSIRLIAAVVLVCGVLAGANLDRLVVQLPAFQRLGASNWAIYSRRADLGHGLLFYPVIAIGAFLLSIVAFFVARADPFAHRALVPLGVTIVLELVGLLLTTQAAPHMFRLRRAAEDDHPLFARSLRGFHRWSIFRGLFQIAAFLSSVWALSVA